MMRQIGLKDTEIDKQRAMIEYLKSKNTELLIKLGGAASEFEDGTDVYAHG